MASLTAYAEPWETEGEHKRRLLESVKNEYPVWEIALGIIHSAKSPGVKYEALKSEVAKSPNLPPGGLNDEDLKLSLSILKKQKLIDFHEKTQTYTTVPGKPLPLR